jgi:transcriptional regulator with XRE-family HTH domain
VQVVVLARVEEVTPKTRLPAARLIDLPSEPTPRAGRRADPHWLVLLGSGYPSPPRLTDLFGERMAVVRKLQGLSQENLAARMRERGHGWKQTTVSKVEAGRRPVSLEEAYDVALELNRHLRDFLKGEVSEHEAATSAYEAATARADEARWWYAEAKRSFETARQRLKAAEVEVMQIVANAPKARQRRKRGS